MLLPRVVVTGSGNDHNSRTDSRQWGVYWIVIVFGGMAILLVGGIIKSCSNRAKKRKEAEELRKRGHEELERAVRDEWIKSQRALQGGADRPVGSDADVNASLPGSTPPVAARRTTGSRSRSGTAATRGPQNTVVSRLPQRSGESSFSPISPRISPLSIQQPQSVARQAGRPRVGSVEEELEPNVELPPSYEERVLDEIYQEDQLAQPAPPYIEINPSDLPAEVQPLQVLRDARTREGVFVRRDAAGREWRWDGERLLVLM